MACGGGHIQLFGSSLSSCVAVDIVSKSECRDRRLDESQTFAIAGFKRGWRKVLNRSELPAFPIRSSVTLVRRGLKSLSRHEFCVIVFATSGIPTYSRSFAQARLTAVIEWTDKGKKTILDKNAAVASGIE
jgi:hypothetical protein